MKDMLGTLGICEPITARIRRRMERSSFSNMLAQSWRWAGVGFTGVEWTYMLVSWHGMDGVGEVRGRCLVCDVDRMFCRRRASSENPRVPLVLGGGGGF